MINSASSTIQDVQYLVDALGDYPELMLKYQSFLPRGDSFQLASDYRDTRVVYITASGSPAIRAAFGFVHTNNGDPSLTLRCG